VNQRGERSQTEIYLRPREFEIQCDCEREQNDEDAMSGRAVHAENSVEVREDCD